jgi:hypothetical protein
MTKVIIVLFVLLVLLTPGCGYIFGPSISGGSVKINRIQEEKIPSQGGQKIVVTIEPVDNNK